MALHLIKLNPFTQGWFVPSLFENGGFFLEEDFKSCQCNLAILQLSPLGKGRALYLNKLESPSPRDTLWQVWLKLAQWFWRRRWKCEKFTDRRTDGQTDDGRQVIRKAHLSFQLRWAKKCVPTVQGVIKKFVDWCDKINTH